VEGGAETPGPAKRREDHQQEKHIKFAPPPAITLRTSNRASLEHEHDPDGGPSHVGVPSSLPIHIHTKVKSRTPLSLASYKPDSAIPEQPTSGAQQTEQAAEPTVNGSSRAIHKAVYAERDRERLIDPGPMDFNRDDEAEEESEDEDADGGSDDDEPPVDESSQEAQDRAQLDRYLATSRGRKYALKIIQARNKLPDSGMWRSLAS